MSLPAHRPTKFQRVGRPSCCREIWPSSRTQTPTSARRPCECGPTAARSPRASTPKSATCNPAQPMQRRGAGAPPIHPKTLGASWASTPPAVQTRIHPTSSGERCTTGLGEYSIGLDRTRLTSQTSACQPLPSPPRLRCLSGSSTPVPAATTSSSWIKWD